MIQRFLMGPANFRMCTWWPYNKTAPGNVCTITCTMWKIIESGGDLASSTSFDADLGFGASFSSTALVVYRRASDLWSSR